MAQSDQQREQPPVEMEAVRTTIVGGRPSGAGKHIGDIPRGIEILIKKAAVDPAFRRLLLERRAAAADEIGLVLDPAEAMIVNAAPAVQLEAIIARTRVDPRIAPAFLGKAAAVMLVALGASATFTDAQLVSKGVRPVTASAPASVPASQPASQPAAAAVNDIPGLLKQLDDNDHKVRQAAQDKLTRLLASDVAAVGKALSEALAGGKLTPEQKLRVENVLTTTQPARPPEVQAVRGARVGFMPAPDPAPRPSTVPATAPAGAAGKPAAEGIQTLIKQLDDNDYRVRQAAQDKLTSMVRQPDVAAALEAALASGKMSPEQKLRLENVQATTRPAQGATVIRISNGVRAAPF